MTSSSTQKRYYLPPSSPRSTSVLLPPFHTVFLTFFLPDGSPRSGCPVPCRISYCRNRRLREALLPCRSSFYSCSFRLAPGDQNESACLTSTITSPASNVSPDTSATCRRQTLGSLAAKSHFQDLPKRHPSSVIFFTRSLHRTRSPSNAFSLKHTTSLFCPQTTHPSCLPRKSLAVTVPYPPSPFLFLTSPFPGGPVRYSWAPPIALTVDKGKRKASDIDDESAPKAGPSTRRKRD